MKFLLVFLLIATALGCAWADDPVFQVNVKDFGAKGDGIADDTAAFKAAFAALTPETDTYRHSKIVYVPAGKYVISDTLELPVRTNLKGEAPAQKRQSSAIIIKDPGFVPIRLSHSSSVSGFSFEYPNNQSVKHCKEYPPTIETCGISPTVENCSFSGAWICVSTPPGGANAPGVYRDLGGWFHHIGIRLDGGLDVARFEDIHWFIGGTDREDAANSHYFKERVGFQFGRQDGVMMSNCFIIHGRALYEQLPVAATGKASHCLTHIINSCWCENVEYGFIFSGMFGVNIDNTVILVKNGGTGIKINNQGSFYNLTISNTAFRGYNDTFTGIDYTAVEDRAQNRMAVTGCQFVGASPAVKLGDESRRITLGDNQFIGRGTEDKPIITIGKGSKNIIIRDNFANLAEGKWIKNEAKGEKTIVLKDNQLIF